MQVVGILLTLLSVTLIVAPVGAVAVIYQNNLTEIIIPPQINNLITGNSSGSGFLVNDTGSVDLGSLISSQFVSADINNDANTFTVVVDVTNNLNYTFALNTLSTEVYSTQDKFHLVSVQLNNPPVTLSPGKTSRVTVNGLWSDAAETYIIQNYSNATSINVQLVNTSININGITVTLSEPINIDVPLEG